MSSQESAEIKVQINSISAVYLPQSLTSSFMMPGGSGQVASRPPAPEIDPNHVQLHVVPLVEELRGCGGGGSIMIGKDDVKRLNLMVGDVVTVKIAKS